MTADDVIDLIDVMANAWPWAEWTGKQADLWCAALADLERGDAAVAVQRAVARLDKPPSIAWVLGEVRNEAERRKVTTPALEEGPVNVDGRKRLIAEMRKMLDEPKPHDHKQGWEGCSTCAAAVKRDGLNPPPPKQAIAAARAAFNRPTEEVSTHGN